MDVRFCDSETDVGLKGEKETYNVRLHQWMGRQSRLDRESSCFKGDVFRVKY